MKVFLAILGFFIVSILVYLGFYNAFYTPKFSISAEGNEIIVYQHVDGRYQLTDSVMKVVFNELYEKNGIVITKGYGLHFYDPNHEGHQMMTYYAGCIVEDKVSLLSKNISNEFNIGKTLKDSCIVTDFPLKGKMSIMFGRYKVYSKLNAFCKKNGYDVQESVTEIYNRTEHKIHYRRKMVKI